MFTFTFPGGETLVATSTGQFGFRDIAGSASISGGTAQFQGATGSFQYTFTDAPGATPTDIQFTVTGSGSVTSASVGALKASPGTLSFAAAAWGNSPASQTVTLLTSGATQGGFTVTWTVLSFIPALSSHACGLCPDRPDRYSTASGAPDSRAQEGYTIQAVKD
jgi:hypothetical protein